ncbi:M23 family metallopeptidase [Terrimonas sp. NA20]|uniref:M23 family metallopeptidase n=1 Tax=Terrimonas ginsenosidimutans TaxID=2908004 RepID=A0ABS9KWI5_9BACT|nr:M23 family metallopeptidase [Terrimonas ginsenosidimutans]MCG2616724.1 M23 family metallopeptidase [Terrimonas ginsenosidimutans]
MRASRIVKMSKWLLAVFAVLVTVGCILFFYQTDVTDQIDPYEYGLPFEKGESFRVVQGYGGLFSHAHVAAIDFAMPVGTSVRAAREGIMYSYKDDSDEGGMFEDNKSSANYIIIKHDDGSFGCYWHLAKNGVLVKKGRVSKGQEIALSGATGLVIRPHLHFSVKRRLTYDKDSFVQTKFKTSKGVLIPRNGRKYERP